MNNSVLKFYTNQNFIKFNENVALNTAPILCSNRKLIPFIFDVGLNYFQVLKFELINYCGLQTYDLSAWVNGINIYTDISGNTFLVYNELMTLDVIPCGFYMIHFKIKFRNNEVVPPVYSEKDYYSDIMKITDVTNMNYILASNSFDFDNTPFSKNYKIKVYFEQPPVLQDPFIEDSAMNQNEELYYTQQVFYDIYEIKLKCYENLARILDRLHLLDTIKIYLNDLLIHDIEERIEIKKDYMNELRLFDISLNYKINKTVINQTGDNVQWTNYGHPIIPPVLLKIGDNAYLKISDGGKLKIS